MDSYREFVDELRTWDTERVVAARDLELVEIRRREARVLAMMLVLDERHALAKDQSSRDGDTDAAWKRKRDTARKLARLPHLANAAMHGELSQAQLDPAAELAGEHNDAEITARARQASPLDLQRMARAQRAKPRREDSLARRARRSLRKWRDDDGYLCGRFELPMEHGGAIVEHFFDRVVERMKPATGEAWEPLERRQADVLIGLCQLEADENGRSEEDRAQQATLGARVDLHVDIPLHGPATMCGVPLPDDWVQAARANARVHLRVVGDDGNVLHEERAKTFVSQKRRRAVIRRDGRCRWPGCRHRLRLQVHHLHPSSWGGPDDSSNLAAVCPYHHGLLIPHGDYVLEGNPNVPDGLTLRIITKEEREQRRIDGMTLAV